MHRLTPDDPPHLGPFRLLGRLGEGGMGRVYLGRSAGGRTVAVKVVQEELARLPEFRRRFAREVAAARRVGGEWTAAVLDADTDAEVPWVATQYIPGPSLHEVVADDHGPLPERSVRVLANRLALALAAVHAAGLVHRDLKPSNVLVSVDGPRVIDFGIARALDALETAAGEAVRTRTGVVVGSPGFMSPEQARGRETTGASDVFCLGSVLAFAATGRQPFGGGGEGANTLLFRVAEEEPDLDGLPAELAELVRACLEKEPAHRPTPREVADRTVPPEAGPWLPGEVLERLGRHAAQLLDLDPTPPAHTAEGPTPTVRDAAGPAESHDAPPVTSPPALPTMPAQPPSRPHPGGGRRRRVLLSAALALALVAAGAGLVALQPWNGGDSGSAADAEVPRALRGVWEGRMAEDGEPDGSRFARLEITAGGEGRRAATVSVLDGQRLCASFSTVDSVSGESGAEKVTLSAGEIDRAVPTSEVGGCAKPSRSTLTPGPGGDRLVWEGDGFTVDLTRTKAPDQTPVDDDHLVGWRPVDAERVADPRGEYTLIRSKVSGTTVGDASVRVRLLRGGMPCHYTGRVFSVRGEQLLTGPLEREPETPGYELCARTQPPQSYEPTAPGTARLRSLDPVGIAGPVIHSP